MTDEPLDREHADELEVETDDRFLLETTGQDAYERVREALRGVRLESKGIHRIRLEIERAPAESEQTTLPTTGSSDGRDSGVNHDSHDSLDRLAVVRRPPTKTTGRDMSDVDPYEGSRQPDAVQPDTVLATVLRALDRTEYITNRELLEVLAEQWDLELTLNQLSAHVSTAYGREFLDREDAEGLAFAHRLNDVGRAALRRGRGETPEGETDG